ncbi:hypothetical protein ACSQ76_04430 [Roseovarius sp. B08]
MDHPAHAAGAAAQLPASLIGRLIPVEGDHFTGATTAETVRDNVVATTG